MQSIETPHKIFVRRLETQGHIRDLVELVKAES